ncbi:alpha/beta fold hydrolase [Hydrogenophaga pseudoflava]|uniref:alpha/beta fold hydrolase n=1 Tax=Hydrogenophaga pseudoflava TaxID=47421 RepID=UPI0027E3E3C6|nr:alpha/beta fold hydrolase [Hydrogenophaga pseudoflava]MDQ7743859.1 alpha/beta fold hydrolase [Hydrogenophaga pseudoflava]
MAGCGPGRAAACARIAALASACERIVQPVLGQQLVWRRVGSGPPLVLLHGGHGSWLHWARVVPALSPGFSLWMPDMPGYGDTTLTPTGGLAELVTQLRQGLDALLGAHTPILLAGFSFGGLVSAQLAAQRGHVQRLVLIGPAGHGGPRRQTITPLPWRHLDPEQDPAEWADRMRHNLLAQMLHSEAAVDALALEIQWRGCLNTRFRSKPFSRSDALAPALGRYPGEVLTIWGEHDVTAVPRELADGVAPQGAPRRTVVVDGAGHWLMHERPAATAQLMRRGA